VRFFRSRSSLRTCRSGLAFLSRRRTVSLDLLLIVAFFLVATSARAREKDKDGIQYGIGVIVNVPYPEADVIQVVQDVTQNGIIRGTKEYNKDQYVTGAQAQTSVRVFPAWYDDGQVFYKVREHAIDPRNFKESGDVGTLAVRYVVRPQGDTHCVLIINAVFVEDFRHTVHESNGSVESAEYKDIHDRLDEIATMKQQTVEAEKEKQEVRERQTAASQAAPPAITPQEIPSSTAPLPVAVATQQQDNTRFADAHTAQPPVFIRPNGPDGPPQTLEEHVQDLRRQVERLVKAPGAPLKSAPFHTASTLQPLPAGTEVLIVITTPYWLGVETHEGQHGWLLRDDLELLP
jgi:hypothetical protein